MLDNSLYKGILYTCIASLFWGLPQPLFFNEISFIPPIEVALHRGVWSFVFLLIITIIIGKFKTNVEQKCHIFFAAGAFSQNKCSTYNEKYENF